MRDENRMKMAGKIACITAIVWALPHFWMGLGITFLFPGDPEDLQNVADASIFWIVGGFALVVAVYALLLTHSFRWMPRSIDSLRWRLPAWVMTFPAWIGGVGLTLWGLCYFALMVQFALEWAQPTAMQDDPHAIWGYYWYTLFLVWGVSAVLAAYYFHQVKNVQGQTTHRISELYRPGTT